MQRLLHIVVMLAMVAGLGLPVHAAPSGTSSGPALGYGPAPETAVNATGNASCSEYGCMAATATGNASCSGDRCLVVAPAGNASCEGAWCAAGTVSGEAWCREPTFQFPLDRPCFAVAVTGDANASHGYAVSLLGDCYGRDCVAVDPTGPARGFWLGASGAGEAEGVVAASLLDGAEGWVAASGTGDADCMFVAYSCFATASGTGEADDRALVSASGCETGQFLGTGAACRDAPADLP